MELRLRWGADQDATEGVVGDALRWWRFEACGVGEHGGKPGFEDGGGFDVLDFGAEGGLVEEGKGRHVSEVCVDASGGRCLGQGFGLSGVGEVRLTACGARRARCRARGRHP